MRPRTTGDRLGEVRDALRTARKGTVRSALYHWMWQNHDGLSALFEEATPAWAILAETFGGMELTDRDGKSPTAKTARMTWYRVRLDVKQFRCGNVRCDARGPSPGFVTIAWTDSSHPSRSPDPLMTPEDTRQDEPPPEPEFKIRFAPGSISARVAERRREATRFPASSEPRRGHRTFACPPWAWRDPDARHSRTGG